MLLGGAGFAPRTPDSITAPCEVCAVSMKNNVLLRVSRVECRVGLPNATIRSAWLAKPGLLGECATRGKIGFGFSGQPFARCVARPPVASHPHDVGSACQRHGRHSCQEEEPCRAFLAFEAGAPLALSWCRVSGQAHQFGYATAQILAKRGFNEKRSNPLPTSIDLTPENWPTWVDTPYPARAKAGRVLSAQIRVTRQLNSPA